MIRYRDEALRFEANVGTFLRRLEDTQVMLDSHGESCCHALRVLLLIPVLRGGMKWRVDERNSTKAFLTALSFAGPLPEIAEIWPLRALWESGCTGIVNGVACFERAFRAVST